MNLFLLIFQYNIIFLVANSLSKLNIYFSTDLIAFFFKVFSQVYNVKAIQSNGLCHRYFLILWIVNNLQFSNSGFLCFGLFQKPEFLSSHWSPRLFCGWARAGLQVGGRSELHLWRKWLSTEFSGWTDLHSISTVQLVSFGTKFSEVYKFKQYFF